MTSFRPFKHFFAFSFQQEVLMRCSCTFSAACCTIVYPIIESYIAIKMKVSVSILAFWLYSFNASTKILAEAQQGECAVDAETGECKAPPILATADNDDDDDYEIPVDEFPECGQWAKDGECTVNRK